MIRCSLSMMSYLRFRSKSIDAAGTLSSKLPRSSSFQSHSAYRLSTHNSNSFWMRRQGISLRKSSTSVVKSNWAISSQLVIKSRETRLFWRSQSTAWTRATAPVSIPTTHTSRHVLRHRDSPASQVSLTSATRSAPREAKRVKRKKNFHLSKPRPSSRCTSSSLLTSH